MMKMWKCAFWTAAAGEVLPKFALVIVIYISSVLSFANGQETAYLFGEDVMLPCAPTAITPGETFIWLDVDEDLNIYIIAAPGVTNKQFDAASKAKYNNFDVDNQYPASVNLKINAIDINDDGSYRCLLSTEASPSATVVNVEALPTSVSVSCTNQRPDECVEPAGVSSVFTCTCTAVGAYPGDLQFVWTNAVGDPTSTSVENSTNRSGAFDYTGSATFRPTDTNNTVTCSLGGYDGSWSVPDSEYTVGPPGKCNISVSCNPEATVATLACSCPNGVPDNTRYTYYNETGAVVTSEVSIEPGVQFTVGCRGCNGVNYGEDTLISKTETCTVTTVTTSTTPTKGGTPTVPPTPPVGIIIAVVVFVLILIIILVLVIWCLKNRDGCCGTHKPDPHQNDDPVIPMNASTTSSLAPLYGEVKKEKKKKSDDSVNDFGNKETPAVYAVPDKNKKRDKPDGNGAGPESDMPTYADVNKPQPTAAPRTSQKVPDDQPMQELQYADLDHGKKPPTNEIRKPQEEPTEYATVQSVIV